MPPKESAVTVLYCTESTKVEYAYCTVRYHTPTITVQATTVLNTVRYRTIENIIIVYHTYLHNLVLQHAATGGCTLYSHSTVLPIVQHFVNLNLRILSILSNLTHSHGFSPFSPISPFSDYGKNSSASSMCIDYRILQDCRNTHTWWRMTRTVKMIVTDHNLTILSNLSNLAHSHGFSPFSLISPISHYRVCSTENRVRVSCVRKNRATSRTVINNKVCQTVLLSNWQAPSAKTLTKHQILRYNTIVRSTES